MDKEAKAEARRLRGSVDQTETIIGCRVTARRASAFRESAIRPAAAGSRLPRLMAEKPVPEVPMPVAVTRHLE